MPLEIAWKQNVLVMDSNLSKLPLVVLGFGSQTFIYGFSRQNICSDFEFSQEKSISQLCLIEMFLSLGWQSEKIDQMQYYQAPFDRLCKLEFCKTLTRSDKVCHNKRRLQAKSLYRSSGEVSLVEQNTIEYVSWPIKNSLVTFLKKKLAFFIPSFYATRSELYFLFL